MDRVTPISVAEQTASGELPAPAYRDPAHDARKAREYRFGGVADRFKFLPYVQADDRVLDFGCRGGHLLASLNCGDRLGIEPDARFRRECAEAGIAAVSSPEEVPDRWADALISHHVLEHMETPYEVLRSLRRTIRPGGTAVFVVPCESVRTRYYAEDPENHLFTWSPLNLGNLFHAAGYRVLCCRAYLHRWPPKPDLVQRWLGWSAFHALAYAYGHVATRLSQSMVVATPAHDDA